MQRITKKITLEQFKSRLPLSYPAINDGKITFVNKFYISLYSFTPFVYNSFDNINTHKV